MSAALSLARMVLDSWEMMATKPGSTRCSGIIDQLLTSAKDIMAGGKPKKTGGIARVVIDEAVDAKIRQLRLYEDLGDLCWMDVAAWRSLSRPVQRAFTKHIDPLTWSGAYFQASRFHADAACLFDQLDEGTAVYELEDRNPASTRTKNHRLIVMTSTGDAYSSLGTMRFRAVAQTISQRVVRAYARTTTGVFIKDFAQC